MSSYCMWFTDKSIKDILQRLSTNHRQELFARIRPFKTTRMTIVRSSSCKRLNTEQEVSKGWVAWSSFKFNTASIFLVGVLCQINFKFHLGITVGRRWLPPLHEVMCMFEPCIEHLIARGKSSSTLCRKSWVFSGFSVFLEHEKLTGWVRMD